MVELPDQRRASAKTNAYAPPVEDGEAPESEASDAWASRHRDRLLVLVYSAAFVSGFVTPAGVREVRVFSVMIFASALSLWCGVDAKLHGKTFLRSYEWLMVFTWPVGILAHLIWTRQARGVSAYLVAAFFYGLALFAGGFLSAGLAMLLNGEWPN